MVMACLLVITLPLPMANNIVPLLRLAGCGFVVRLCFCSWRIWLVGFRWDIYMCGFGSVKRRGEGRAICGLML